MIKKYDEFINEEINWSKKPWVWLKNILKLEEPEYDEPEEEIGPNDEVVLSTNFSVNILKLGNSVELEKSIRELYKVYNVTGSIIQINSNSFQIKAKGKKKDVDVVYNTIKNAILK